MYIYVSIVLYTHTIYKTSSSYLLGGVRIRQIEDIDERASQVALVVRNPPASAGDVGDPGSIPGSERSPGEGNGNQLQYSCLENFMDRGVWQVRVHGVAKSQPELQD